MCRAGIGRNICIIVEEHRQPASEVVKEAADPALKEFDEIACVGDRQSSNASGVDAGLPPALGISNRFWSRAAGPGRPGPGWAPPAGGQIHIDGGSLVGLNPDQALPFGISDPVPFSVGATRENNVCPEP